MGAILRGPARYNKKGIVRRESRRTLIEDKTNLGLRAEIDPPAVEAPLVLALMRP